MILGSKMILVPVAIVLERFIRSSLLEIHKILEIHSVFEHSSVEIHNDI